MNIRNTAQAIGYIKFNNLDKFFPGDWDVLINNFKYISIIYAENNQLKWIPISYGFNGLDSETIKRNIYLYFNYIEEIINDDQNILNYL